MRDDAAAGRAVAALAAAGFDAAPFPVLREGPAPDPAALAAAAIALDRYHWVVCASARAVRALRVARGGAWPPAVRTAAVGPATAAALLDAGAVSVPVVAATPGAEALWTVLMGQDRWPGRRVLLPTVAGGLRILRDRMEAAGAAVDEVEAYSMTPYPPDELRARWLALGPEAAVFASPSAVRLAAQALGRPALAGLRVVVAIGPTTASALADLGVSHSVPPGTAAQDVASHLAGLRAASPPS